MISNLLIISKDFDLESSNYVKDLCMSLAGDGIETHVVCYGAVDKDYSIGDKLHIHQVKFELGANNTYNWHMLMNNELKRRSRELMEENNFDMIHCIDWSSYPAAVGISNVYEKPYVITLNSTEKERGFGINESGMISEIEWLSTYDANHVIALNQTTRDILVHDYKIPEEKVTLTENPVEDTKRIYSQLAQ